MSSASAGWTDPGWWERRIRLHARPATRRRQAVIVAIVGWVALYPLMLVEAILYPSQIILLLIAAILTSEGFLSTTIALSRWAGTLGSAYYVAARDVIGSEVSAKGGESVSITLGRIADEFEPCLDKTYGSTFSRPKADSDCSVERLSKALAEACRSPQASSSP
jgi:hypothetical protein